MLILENRKILKEEMKEKICNKIFKDFEDFYFEKCIVGGYDAILFTGENAEKLLENKMLLEKWNIKRGVIERNLDTIKNHFNNNLFLSLVYCKESTLSFEYPLIPFLCFKFGNQYQLVTIHDQWMCTFCGFWNKGVTLTPLIEDESELTYKFLEKSVLPIFKKRKCEKCGHYLNPHFLMERELL